MTENLKLAEGYVPSLQKLEIQDPLNLNQKIQLNNPILVSIGAENTTTTLYSVPSSNRFALQGIVFSNSTNTGVTGQGYISINGVDIFGILAQGGTCPLFSMVFPQPIIYPKGTIIRLSSEIAGCIVFATILGYLID